MLKTSYFVNSVPANLLAILAAKHGFKSEDLGRKFKLIKSYILPDYSLDSYVINYEVIKL